MSAKKSYLSDLSKERIDKLFRDLDVNNDGTIDIKDLTAALNRLRIPQLPKHAETFIRVHDNDKSGDINYGEFVSFVKERQQFLKRAFERFDKDRDGQISVEELKATFRDAGIELTTEDCYDLLEKLDRHKSLTITWNEWVEFFLLQPGSNKPVEFWNFWNHALIDVGEPGLIPTDDFDTRLRLFWRNLVAGGVAGAVSRTATAPIDRLKIFLQVYGEHFGLVNGLKKLVREGGLIGMFRGNFVNVLKIAPETAVKFACFERIKKIIRNNTDREIGPIERFIAGSLAGALSQSSIYPMEVIKTRLALGRTGEYKGITDCARLILKHEGLRSFYRGYLPSVIGIVPYAGIDLAVYETLRTFYSRNGTQEPSVLVTLLCGVVSSTAAQLASFPLNVLRTNMQAKGNLGGGRDTMSGLFVSIWREHGIRGLYRGIIPSILKTAPAISITYVVYEKIRKHIVVE